MSRLTKRLHHPDTVIGMDTTSLTLDYRLNTALAIVVDQALTVNIEHGAMAAARVLSWHGASFALTVRVLTEPAQRRACAYNKAK